MSEQFGKMLIGVGLTIALIGAVVLMSSKVPGLRLGRLPGDINVQRDGFALFIPITSMLLVSALLSFILFVVQRIKR